MTMPESLAHRDAATVHAAGPMDLVLEGGGVKGVGLVGAALALDSAGYRVKRVAGTSAGAIVASIIAALVAKNQPLTKLHDVLNTVSYPDFKKNSGLRGKLGAIGSAEGLLFHMGLYDGDYLVEWLGNVLHEIGVDHFSDLPLDDPDADRNLTKDQLYTLVVHTAEITRKRVVRLPWDYRAYGLEPGNQRIVDAVRASMAIPFFFEPVRFRAPAGNLGGQACPAGDVVWVDGGMLDNYPLDVFDRSDGAPSRWPTVGIKLSARETAVTTADVDDTVTEALACLQTLLDNADRYYVDQEHQRDTTIFVDSAGISTTDFGLTQAQQKTLFDNGQSAAQTWIAAQAPKPPPVRS